MGRAQCLEWGLIPFLYHQLHSGSRRYEILGDCHWLTVGVWSDDWRNSGCILLTSRDVMSPVQEMADRITVAEHISLQFPTQTRDQQCWVWKWLWLQISMGRVHCRHTAIWTESELSDFCSRFLCWIQTEKLATRMVGIPFCWQYIICTFVLRILNLRNYLVNRTNLVHKFS